MSTNLIQIPQDVLIHDILDQLEIPDLIHILTTNRELGDKYLPIFEEKIEDYREDLRHRREVAGPKYIQNLEQNQQYLARLRSQNELQGVAGIIALNDQLAQSMSVENLGLPKLRGRILYSQSGLIRWWQIYVRDNNLINSTTTYVINQKTRTRNDIMVDNLISNLLNLPVGTIINFSRLTQELLTNHTELIREPVSDQVLYALNREMRELDEIYYKYQ